MQINGNEEHEPRFSRVVVICCVVVFGTAVVAYFSWRIHWIAAVALIARQARKDLANITNEGANGKNG